MCACEHGHLNIAKRLLLEPHCDASIEDNVSYIQISHVTFSSQSYLLYREEALLNQWPSWIITKLAKSLYPQTEALAPSFFSFAFVVVVVK